MKKIFCILLVCILMLTGCKEETIEKIPEKNYDTSMFVEIERTITFRIVYCKSTKVMYAVSHGSYNYGTFTLLVNADGTPMLYEGD